MAAEDSQAPTEPIFNLSADEMATGPYEKATRNFREWFTNCEGKRVDIDESIITRVNSDPARLSSHRVRMIVAKEKRQYVFTRLAELERDHIDSQAETKIPDLKKTENSPTDDKGISIVASSMVVNDDGCYFRELGSASGWVPVSESIAVRKLRFRDYRNLPLSTAAEIQFTMKQRLGLTKLLDRQPTGGTIFDDGSIEIEWASIKSKVTCKAYFSNLHGMMPIRLTLNIQPPASASEDDAKADDAPFARTLSSWTKRNKTWQLDKVSLHYTTPHKTIDRGSVVHAEAAVRIGSGFVAESVFQPLPTSIELPDKIDE
ncbi:hypothetical protein [Rubripirellula reticaptiva]|uniref:hypothetical protein n=1 Tax=Rubripirellula reticaptiva TaxID=2528013 RepID=UPI0011B3F19C|nr:hypothetical protein [Rubripirellula reticaptiva]